MLERIRENKKIRLLLGLLAGVAFGFLLQKGGVTKYDVILGQLLLEDFTVVKVMLSAVVVGTLGVHLMRSGGWVKLHPKPGSVGKSVLGGLVFGAGFALLGYCPGTIAGAVGNGYIDAALGGVVGILLGTWLFALAYPGMQKRLLALGDFGDKTLPELLEVNAWYVVVPVAGAITVFLYFLEGWT
jgi:uncharacterized protein